MNVEPIRDSIIVTKAKNAETTASGLYIAHAEEKHVEGTVVAVGTGRVTMSGTVVPLEVKVGDRILYNKNFATEIKDGDNVFLVLKEEHVLCKYK